MKYLNGLKNFFILYLFLGAHAIKDGDSILFFLTITAIMVMVGVNIWSLIGFIF